MVVNGEKKANPSVYYFASETEGNLLSEGICTLSQREKFTYGNYNVFAHCIRGQSIKRCMQPLFF